MSLTIRPKPCAKTREIKQRTALHTHYQPMFNTPAKQGMTMVHHHSPRMSRWLVQPLLKQITAFLISKRLTPMTSWSFSMGCLMIFAYHRNISSSTFGALSDSHLNQPERKAQISKTNKQSFQLERPLYQFLLFKPQGCPSHLGVGQKLSTKMD